MNDRAHLESIDKAMHRIAVSLDVLQTRLQGESDTTGLNILADFRAVHNRMAIHNKLHYEIGG